MEAMRGKDGVGTSTGGSAEMVARDTERWREAARAAKPATRGRWRKVVDSMQNAREGTRTRRERGSARAEGTIPPDGAHARASRAQQRRVVLQPDISALRT